MSHLRSGYLLQGRYSIQRVLGQGGFGITYLAFDVVLSIEVCVKELYVSGQCTRRDGVQVETGGGSGVDFGDFVVRFMDEARSLARFDHDGIVGVRDVFEGNGTAYLVMEYVVGETLKGRVEREGAFSESEALVVFKQLLSAVEEVHGRGMLHRDIKPDNVMLTSGGRVVLIDFGTAREFAEGRTSTHSVMLTPGYAPPEQYSMRAQRGTFTDVYALGATLYFLLTGEKPLAAPERSLEELVSPSKLTEGKVSDRVSEAVMRAMAIRPGDRFQTVGEMRAGLVRNDGKRTGEAQSAMVGKGQRSARKSRVVAIWVGVLLVVFGINFFYRNNSETQPELPATLSADTSRYEPLADQPKKLDPPTEPEVEVQVEKESGDQKAEITPDVKAEQQEQPKGRKVEESSGREAEKTELSSKVQDIDGNVYRTVRIGNQVWMAENLRTTRFRNGDKIPGNLSDDQWSSTTSGAQAVYENNSSNLSTYGRLYNWYAVKDSRGLCPAGWHVPSDAEWTELERSLGGEEVAGTAMKSSKRDYPAWDGSNTSGFSGLPGGYRGYASGNFRDQGVSGNWWSSSPSGAFAWYRSLSSGNSNVARNPNGTRSGFSVRCVRD